MAAYTSGSDTQRPLTKQGRNDVATVIRDRHSSLGDIEAILTSPYRRAQETAEIVAQGLSRSDESFVCEQLIPESSPEALIKYLDNLSWRSVLLTTHQPLVGHVITLLLGDRQLQAIEPGCLVAMEAELLLPGCAELCWVQHPES